MEIKEILSDALHALINPFRQAYYSIRQIVAWLPVLWRDRDWDYDFMLELFAFKLERMRKCILSSGIAEEDKKNHDSIKVCEDALRRLRADEYLGPEWEAHYVKFPNKKAFRVSEGIYEYSPMGEDERIDFLRLTDAEEKARQADIDLFCKQFAAEYRSWWN